MKDIKEISELCKIFLRDMNLLHQLSNRTYELLLEELQEQHDRSYRDRNIIR